MNKECEELPKPAKGVPPELAPSSTLCSRTGAERRKEGVGGERMGGKQNE